MIQQNSPQRFEWRNFRRKFRTRAIGDIHLIEMEIDAETWQQLDTMPKDADGEMVIWWTTRGEAPAKESKKPKPKGQYGQFWRRMAENGVFENRDLWEYLEVEEHDAVLPALRKRFEVESMTFVSPKEAIQAFETINLHGVASIARRLAESER